MTRPRDCEIRPARVEEADALTALALRAKAVWGHDAAFLERAAPDLAVTPDDIKRLVVRVAERGGHVVGFAAVDPKADPAELVALFVEPAAMRTGAGRTLLKAAVAEAKARNIAALLIESDPDAEGFYLAQGAERIGERIAPSTGRLLPLLRLTTALVLRRGGRV